MRRPVRVIDDIIPSIVGGNVSIQSQVVPAKAPPGDDSWLNQRPLVSYNDAPVEGTDYPFFTRQEFWAINQAARTARWRYRLAFRDRTDDDLSVPLTVNTVPPVTSNLNFGEGLSFEGRPTVFRRRERALKLHRLSIEPQDGLTARDIPASTYQTDSCQLMTEIQQHLLEGTIDSGLTWSLWSTDEVLAHINERISRFLVETGILQTIQTITTTPGLPFYDLPTDLIDLTRLDYNGAVLTRTTKWEMDHSLPGWQLFGTGTPDRYMLWPEESLTIRLHPAPPSASTIRVIYVADPPAVTSVCRPLPLPAAFVPYIKFGVMADMLSKQGEANDPIRAAYCEERWKEGVDMALALLGIVQGNEQ